MKAPPFALTKWYVDCVEPGGRAAIVYWAALSWRGIRLSWHSLTVFQPDGSPCGRSSRRRIAPPAVCDGVVRWTSPGLDCSLRCAARRTPFELRLLDGDDGAVDWRCEAAAGETTIEYGGGPALQGAGYAERLTLSVLPWRLPIDELLWGRWISGDLAHAIVWIEWRGSHPQTVVLMDGRPEPGARVMDQGVAIGRDTLTLSDSQALHARSLGDIARRLGRLSRLVPSSFLALSQTKWRSRGAFQSGAATESTGWAVHEHVRFR